MFLLLPITWSTCLLVGVALGQQQCYFGPGAEFRGPAELVPCNPTGSSACCLLGDVCLSGNACYDPDTGNTYQYGCTDVSYSDSSCPFKCGFDPRKSPWTALTQCGDVSSVEDTWVCHGPESCGCEWRGPTYDMLVLSRRSCKAMGDEALVALRAPSQLAPYLSLPSTTGGSTGYFSFYATDGSSTWVTTVISGYTPAEITPFTTYLEATTSEFIDENAAPDSATYAPASFIDGSLPSPVTNAFPSSGAPPNTAQPSPGASSPSEPTSTTDSSQSEPSSSFSGTPSTPTMTTSTSTSTSTAASSSGGLSTGAKAGIGVGVAVGVLVILGLIAALIIMRRRHRRQLRDSFRPSEMEQDPHVPGGLVDAKARDPLMMAEPKDGAADGGYAFAQKKADETAWKGPAPPMELPADASVTVHELETGAAELSARTSVRGSPRSRGHINSIGSVFREEGID